MSDRAGRALMDGSNGKAILVLECLASLGGDAMPIQVAGGIEDDGLGWWPLDADDEYGEDEVRAVLESLSDLPEPLIEDGPDDRYFLTGAGNRVVMESFGIDGGEWVDSDDTRQHGPHDGYVLFLDESGEGRPTAKKPVTHPQFYVLAGVAVPMSEWRSFSDNFWSSLRAAGIPWDTELKFSDIGNRVAEIRKGTSGKPTNPLHGLTNEDAVFAARNAVLRLVPRHRLVVFSAAFPKVAAPLGLWRVGMDAGRSYDEMKDAARNDLVERFSKFMEARDAYGMVVMDSGANKDADAATMKAGFRHSRHGQWDSEAPGRIVEFPLLVPSHLSPGVMVADFVAGTLAAGLEGRAGGHERAYEVWDSIYRHDSPYFIPGILGGGVKIVPSSLTKGLDREWLSSIDGDTEWGMDLVVKEYFTELACGVCVEMERRSGQSRDEYAARCGRRKEGTCLFEERRDGPSRNPEQLSDGPSR